MNWRLATLINAAIAAVTVIAAITLHSPTTPRTQTSPSRSIIGVGTSEPASWKPTSIAQPVQPAGIDVAHTQVDSFATVAPSEFYEILLRATPEEIAALALKFNELPVNSRSGGAIGMFFQAWAELDGPAALQGAFRINDVPLRRVAANTVLHSMSPSVAREMATYLRDYPDKDLAASCQNEFMEAVLSRWADVDPSAAAQFYDDLGKKSDALTGSVPASIAWSWGTLDPNAALDWIQKQSNEQYSGSLFDSVVTGWVRNDPPAAMNYVVQHLDRPGANSAAASIAVELLNRDPQSAGRWINNLPPGEARSSAEQSLTYTWAERDPAAAARWTQELPVDDQASAAFTVARIWAGQDWPETQRWLAGLSGDYRDSAIAGAVVTGQVDPAESLPLAESMTNVEARLHTLQGIIENWADSNRDEAAIWIKNSTITREEKEQLLGLDIFREKSNE